MIGVVVVGGASHTVRAIMVPLRSRLGMTTDPVGVLDPRGVAVADVSVDVSASVSLLDVDGPGVELESNSA